MKERLAQGDLSQSSVVRRSHAPAQIALVALATAVVFQLVRVFLPIVFDLGERSGTTSGALKAGALALAISLTPLLGPLFPKLLGSRRGVVAAIGGAALLRFAIQVVHPVPLWLAALGMAVGLVALSLLLDALRRAKVAVSFSS